MTTQSRAAVPVTDLVDLLDRARKRAGAAEGDSTYVPTPAEIDIDALSRELGDLFWATGIADDGSELRAVWLALRRAGRENADHAADATAYRRIARASNPLAPEVCFGHLATALRRKIRARVGRMPWQTADAVPLVGSIDWTSLTADQQALIRTMALELSGYHRGLVKAHRPTKDLLDTLMEGLAELFVRYSGQHRSVIQLETARESLFIQFCHTALLPFVGAKPFVVSEIEPASLSQRWRRLQRRAGA